MKCQTFKVKYCYNNQSISVFEQWLIMNINNEKYDHKEKEGTIKFCQDTFPTVNLLATKRSKVPSDGLADAIALAVYASIDTENEKI